MCVDSANKLFHVLNSWSCDESDCEARFSSVYALKKHVCQHHEKETYKVKLVSYMIGDLSYIGLEKLTVS